MAKLAATSHKKTTANVDSSKKRIKVFGKLRRKERGA